MIDIIIPTILERDNPIIVSLIAEIIRTAPGCPILATCTKASASVNRNLGLDASRSDIVVMIDDDVTGLPLGWAEKLEHTFRTQPNAVMVAPQLMKPDGEFGFMMGLRRPKTDGLSRAAGILPTACIAIGKNDLRFDENFIGSGFEDNDYCAQLRVAYPHAVFLVNHDIRVIHKNECKNQHGAFWEHNKTYFHNKWNREQ